MGPEGHSVPTIAIVEDNDDNLMLFEAMLEDSYEIRAFCDGPSALGGLAAGGVDLILLDISLPGMDGIEVLKRLRGRDQTRDLPIVALTAHAMRGDEDRFLAEGFDAYLAKPIIDEDAFFATIARLLEDRA